MEILQLNDLIESFESYQKVSFDTQIKSQFDEFVLPRFDDGRLVVYYTHFIEVDGRAGDPDLYLAVDCTYNCGGPDNNDFFQSITKVKKYDKEGDFDLYMLLSKYNDPDPDPAFIDLFN